MKEISLTYFVRSFTSSAFFKHFWLIAAVLSFDMRFSNLNFAALLALPFLTGAAPVEDATSTKGYQMGVFYVNWVLESFEIFQNVC